MITRAQEVLIHEKVMGKCCHAGARKGVREDAITIRCDACGAALSWCFMPHQGESAGFDSPSAVLQNHIPRYGGNRVLADEIVRRLQRKGWVCAVVSRDAGPVCIARRGQVEVEGPAAHDYSEAVCATALKLAESGALILTEQPRESQPRRQSKGSL